MSRFKAVLFDYDGTLMDTNELIFKSWSHLFKTVANKVIVPSDVTPSYGETLPETIKKYFPGADTEAYIEIYRSYQKTIYDDEVKLFPGIKEMLEAVKKLGISTCIVTSRVKASTLEGLQRFGIADYFTEMVTMEDTDEHKPLPGPCNTALKKMNLLPCEVLYVGDSKYDTECAHNAGIEAVLVNWTVCCPEEERVGIRCPDYVIEKPEDLLDILQK